MDKKYNAVLGIMIFLFIIVVGVAIAWGLGVIGIKEDYAKMDKQTSINQNDNNAVKVENNITKEEEKENTSNLISNSNVSDKLTTNVNLLQLDSSKCLNDKENIYNVSVESGNGYYIQYQNGKITISITKDSYMNNYEIKGIDANKVAEAFLLGRGQDLIYPIAFFLMKAGTVEWLDVKNAVENNDFNAEGKITNVTGVVRIVNVGVGPKNGEGPGWMDIIGIKADGSFYNLGSIVSK